MPTTTGSAILNIGMINSNFGFTPLKEVWLGDCYPEAFYDHLPNKIADPFRQITEWTKHDLTQVHKFLESRGITVKRPKFESIDNFLDTEDTLIKPPITPRDDYLVLGNTLYALRNKAKVDPWFHELEDYKKAGQDVRVPAQGDSLNEIMPPSVVRIGRDIYMDVDTHSDKWKSFCEVAVEWSKNYRVNICNTFGHSDAVFCPVQPGVLVSSHYKNDYHRSFPNWKVLQIRNRFNGFEMQEKNIIDSIPNTKAFSNYVIRRAKDWVGNFRETVFEVNMLVLDQNNVICMKDCPPIFRQLEQHGITPHVFDFRCRSFWDGGWHCLTLDICREDTKQDLFPDRGENGVFWRMQ